MQIQFRMYYEDKADKFHQWTGCGGYVRNREPMPAPKFEA